MKLASFFASRCFHNAINNSLILAIKCKLQLTRIISFTKQNLGIKRSYKAIICSLLTSSIPQKDWFVFFQQTCYTPHRFHCGLSLPRTFPHRLAKLDKTTKNNYCKFYQEILSAKVRNNVANVDSCIYQKGIHLDINSNE